MGRVISLINATPDGFVDAEYTIADDGFYDFTFDLLSHTKTIAFGRSTFELFQDRWPPILQMENVPESKLRMAMALSDAHKIVYSTTLQTTTWKNSAIARRIDHEHINAYKQVNEGGLLTLGSPSLVETLTQLKLIDDYYFCIQPLIAGRGIARLFSNMNLGTSHALKYVDSKSLKSGVQIIHYKTVH